MTSSTELYGRAVVDCREAEIYRLAANQIVKAYSERGELEEIQKTERVDGEIFIITDNYNIRTYTCLMTEEKNTAELAVTKLEGGTIPEDDRETLEEMGADLKEQVAGLLG